MINDDDEKYSYFAVKSKLELYSSEWLRSKKESITSEDNYFQNALNDSQIIEPLKHTQKEYQNLSHTLIAITGKTKFCSDKEDWKKFEQNNQEIAFYVLFLPYNKKEIEPAYISE